MGPNGNQLPRQAKRGGAGPGNGETKGETAGRQPARYEGKGVPQMAFSDSRYAQMEYRRCGRSGLLLPAISLGCWHNFGDRADQDVARQMLHRAFDLGITHFDLANNYGPPPGSAERNVGRILKEDFAAHRDELILPPRPAIGWARPLRRLGLELPHRLADQSLKWLGVEQSIFLPPPARPRRR